MLERTKFNMLAYRLRRYLVLRDFKILCFD